MSKSRNVQFTRPLHYQTYILRFWQESGASEETAVWRFTLINTITNSEYGFATFEDLVDFLTTQLEAKDL